MVLMSAPLPVSHSWKSPHRPASAAKTRGIMNARWRDTRLLRDACHDLGVWEVLAPQDVRFATPPPLPGSDHAAGDVTHVDEAIDARRVPRDCTAHDRENHQSRTGARVEWPEHEPETRDDRVDVVGGRPEDHFLTPPLGSGVPVIQAEVSEIPRMALVDRLTIGRDSDRRRRGTVDQAANTASTNRLDHATGPLHVHRLHSWRYGCDDLDLGRAVEDRVGSVEGAGETVRILKVGGNPFDRHAVEVFDLARRSTRTTHRVPGLGEQYRQVGPKKARGAGDRDLHGAYVHESPDAERFTVALRLGRTRKSSSAGRIGMQRGDSDTTMPTAPHLRFPPEFAALRGTAKLAVYIDLKSPYAYIAIDPTRAMATNLGVEIDWRPFTLDIPSYLGSAKLAKDGKKVESSERSPQQWTGVKYAYRDARRYAQLTNKTVRGTIKIWDSSKAGIAMLWAKERDAFDRFVDTAYPPFWRRELDIDDWGVLEQTLVEASIDVGGFREWAEGAGRELHDRTNLEAFDVGVYGVPTYLVEDEMWFGREHLPRVAWILGGRAGPAPDVANRGFGT